MKLVMDGISIEVTHKAIKSVTLRVYPPEGTVKMSVPKHYKDCMIQQILHSKLAWIKCQRNNIQSHTYLKPEALQTGSYVEFLGKHYLLIIEEHKGPKGFVINDGIIHCYCKPLSSPTQIEHQLDNWYKNQMYALLPDLITRWQAIIGVEVKEWGIKKMKTRWGSCNTRVARIWLNLNLIKKPIGCLEYVLVHELVHLLEASHNARFYTLMTQFMPQWQDHQFALEGKRRRTQRLIGATID